MQAIPVKVKNVNVYPFVEWPPNGGIGPVLIPVIEGATGTYAVGTLITSIFYNVDLSSGSGALVLHQQYTITGETEDGKSFNTPWMYCTNNGNEAEFGRTITLDQPSTLRSDVIPQYNILGPLTDITVSQQFPSPAIGQITLIENGSGNSIATKVGTPHEMGVEVIKGSRSGILSVGMKNIMISGKNKEGKMITFGNLVCLNAGEPAIFIHQFI